MNLNLFSLFPSLPPKSEFENFQGVSPECQLISETNHANEPSHLGLRDLAPKKPQDDSNDKYDNLLHQIEGRGYRQLFRYLSSHLCVKQDKMSTFEPVVSYSSSPLLQHYDINTLIGNFQWMDTGT